MAWAEDERGCTAARFRLGALAHRFCQGYITTMLTYWSIEWECSSVAALRGIYNIGHRSDIREGV